MMTEETGTFDMVFEGGGAKGMVFVGAMEAFMEDERGLTFDRLIGSSAGAITATLLAAKYSATEMLEALEEQTADGRPIFATFMGAPKPFSKEDVANSGVLSFLRDTDMLLVPDFIENRLDEVLANALAQHKYGMHLFSLVDRGGLFAADAFVKWFSEKLDVKWKQRVDAGDVAVDSTRYSEMTLKQFFNATQHELSITASDVTSNRLLILNHRTAPEMSVVWAVRSSMSIPMLWEEVIWQPEWGTYTVGDHDAADLTGHALVDGGLLSNFPIELLVSDAAHVALVMGEKSSQNGVIGLLIDDGQQVDVEANEESDKNQYLELLGQTNTMRRLRSLINTVTAARDKMVIRAVADKVVKLPAGGYGTTEFGMSTTRRDALVDSGYAKMEAYLKRMPEPGSKGESRGVTNVEWAEVDRIALDILGR